MFMPVDYDRVVLGGGDLNSRVGDNKVQLVEQKMRYLNNIDSVFLNDDGKDNLKICRTFRCFIVNNLKFKDNILEGDFTFNKGRQNPKMM